MQVVPQESDIDVHDVGYGNEDQHGRVCDCLVLLDLQAMNGVDRDVIVQEIVEWTWMLFNVEERRVVERGSMKLQPRWSVLYDDEEEEERLDLQTAVNLFDQVLYQKVVNSGESFCIVTDGSWSRQQLFLIEAIRKGVSLAPHYHCFLDLRSEFRKCYPSIPWSSDSSAMFDYLNISAKEDSCSGMEDIVMKMLEAGHCFYVPDSMHTMDWVSGSLRIPAQATPIAAGIPVGGIVRLRGLPWSSTENDVSSFFGDIAIVPNGIHMVVNRQQKPTGEAFVQVPTMDAVDDCFSLHRQMMDKRYIEVFKSSPQEMTTAFDRADTRRSGGVAMQSYSPVPVNPTSNAAAAAAAAAAVVAAAAAAAAAAAVTTSVPVPVPFPITHIVKLRGIPYTATVPQVLNFFDGLEVVGRGVHLVYSTDTRMVGEAFVELSSEAMVKKALERNRKKIGSRYIEIFRSSPADMITTFEHFGGASGRAAAEAALTIGRVPVIPLGSSAGGVGRPAGASGTDSCHLRMRGLPYSILPDQIFEFFAGLHIQDELSLFYDPRGRPTGEAIVGFASVEERERAMTRNKQILGNRYIELFRMSAMEVMATIGMGMGVIEYPQLPATDGSESESSSVPVSSAPTPIEVPLPTTEGPAQSAEEIPPSAEGTPPFTGGTTPSTEGQGRSGTTTEARTLSEEEEIEKDKDARASGGGGRIVRMRGLPYRCSPVDIADFFKEYEIVENGIAMGSDRHGRASGEAWVTFKTAEAAEEAASALNKHHIGSRYIELLVMK